MEKFLYKVDKILNALIAFLVITLFAVIMILTCACSTPTEPELTIEYTPDKIKAELNLTGNTEFESAFANYMYINGCLIDRTCVDDVNDYTTGINGQCLLMTNKCKEAYNDLYWLQSELLQEHCNGNGTCKDEIKKKYL